MSTFGIPCPEDDAGQAMALLTDNNTILRDMVYQILYPVAVGLSDGDKALTGIANLLKRRTGSILKKNEDWLVDSLNALGQKVGQELTYNETDLAIIRAACTQLPPAVEAPEPPVEYPTVQTSFVPTAEPPPLPTVAPAPTVGVNQLLQLLYAIGITPTQVRHYLDNGIVPQCPQVVAPAVAPVVVPAPPEYPVSVEDTEPTANLPDDAPIPLIEEEAWF